MVVLVIKKQPASAGDLRDGGSIPELGRSPGGGHGNPPQYSCLENSMDREPSGLQSIGSLLTLLNVSQFSLWILLCLP